MQAERTAEIATERVRGRGALTWRTRGEGEAAPVALRRPVVPHPRDAVQRLARDGELCVGLRAPDGTRVEGRLGDSRRLGLAAAAPRRFAGAVGSPGRLCGALGGRPSGKVMSADPSCRGAERSDRAGAGTTDVHRLFAPLLRCVVGATRARYASCYVASSERPSSGDVGPPRAVGPDARPRDGGPGSGDSCSRRAGRAPWSE